ncbi:MAG: hypothetical protein B7Z66_14575 [Chromatiales bacterium 21-64-14]|nr:MAG: hypothetical protein B7Z66_14575 [Chromatiales bacterium 21-64-14]
MLKVLISSNGASVFDGGPANTEEEVRRGIAQLCDPDYLTRVSKDVLIAKGAGAAHVLFPPDDVSRDLAYERFGLDDRNEEDMADVKIVAYSPYGTPLVLLSENVANMATMRPLIKSRTRFNDPRFLYDYERVQDWLSQLQEHSEKITLAMREIRGAFGEDQNRPGVHPFVADVPTLWGDPIHTPEQYGPCIMCACSWRAIRWFPMESPNAFSFALVRNDDINRWMPFEPGVTTAAQVREWWHGP